MISNSIDYLRMTGQGLLSELSELAIYDTGISEKPMYGYEKCRRLQFAPESVAGLFMTGKSGELIQFSGKQLQHLQDNGIEAIEILSVLHKKRATRIDLAVDAYGYGETEEVLSDFYDKVVTGQATTLSKCFGRFQSTVGDKTGSTVYVGSRKSERYFRAYNKGVESGSELSDWVRFELECKAGQARVSKDMILSQGLERTTKAQMVDFLMIEGVYEKALGELEEGVLIRVPRTQKDDMIYLTRVVIPYLKSRMGKINHYHMALILDIVREWHRMKNLTFEGDNIILD